MTSSTAFSQATFNDMHLQFTLRLPVVPQIQVTRGCNLRCNYCFQSHPAGSIEIPTVAIILDKVIAHNLRVDPDNRVIQVYWHGGEPLLAGLEFFQDVIRLEKKYPGLTFDNRLQTNGTLLNDGFAHLFHANHFHLGFSLDGPRDIHDRHRRFHHHDDGSFEATMAGIACYRRHQEAKPAPVIAVITRHSVRRAQELYSFFKELKTEVQLDLYDLRPADFTQMAETSLAPSPQEIGQFLIDLFDLWFYDQQGGVDFKELRQEVKMILQPELDLGDPFDKKRCDFRRLIFSPDGLAFSCDQWLNDEKSTLGDIRTDPLDQILVRKNTLWQQIKQVIRQSGKAMGCGSCEWARQCGGGCLSCMKYNVLLSAVRAAGHPDHRWAEQQLPPRLAAIAGETYYCAGLRRFRSHVRRAVELELANEGI